MNEPSYTKMRAALDQIPGLKISENHSLADYTTFRTGGNARFFADVTTAEQFREVIGKTAELEIPFFVLGGGSNLLVSDKGYRGLVIKNSIKGMSRHEAEIDAGAGEKLEDLVNFAAAQGLTGLEFAYGIWGTVGGAICGNAGAYGADIGAVLKSAQLVDRKGNIRDVPASYLEFGYRSSRLKTSHEYVISARFALKKGDKDAILSRIAEIKTLRETKLPLDKRSAGCFFKNIIDSSREHGKLPAGQLLEQIGAKNMRVGGARVSEKHANIIINDGPATSEEIKQLAEILKRKVKETFGIELREEITYLGDF